MRKEESTVTTGRSMQHERRSRTGQRARGYQARARLHEAFRTRPEFWSLSKMLQLTVQIIKQVGDMTNFQPGEHFHHFPMGKTYQRGIRVEKRRPVRRQLQIIATQTREKLWRLGKAEKIQRSFKGLVKLRGVGDKFKERSRIMSVVLAQPSRWVVNIKDQIFGGRGLFCIFMGEDLQMQVKMFLKSRWICNKKDPN